jgi:hypothetical protein
VNGPEAEKLVDAALRTLHEHFNAVQVLVSWNEQAETRAVYRGTGNFHARIGMAYDFIKKDDAQTMAVEISDQLQPPPDDAEQWKSQP